MLKPNIEQMVINDLLKTGRNLLMVLDRDSKAAVRDGPSSDLSSAINCNLRTIAAVNEVLLYYGDAGLFAELPN
jgi:hypothetical protein